MMRAIAALTLLIATLLTAHFAFAQDQRNEEPTLAEEIAGVAKEYRHRLQFDGQTFSGPGWDRLVEEGIAAQFFLIGEEHGIAENPKLVAQLFTALKNTGYSKLAIEISPAMAKTLDTAILNGGLEGLRSLFGQPGGEPAFFGMAEEAEMLATVRAAVARDTQAFWGLDYEVAGDRTLLRILASKPKPDAAGKALASLQAASEQAWTQYRDTGGPQFIFSFSGDPELVRAVTTAWPDRDEESDWILHTLEETLEINRLWINGQGWESNRRRAALIRSNFLRYWKQAQHERPAPKIMAKFGSNHVVRGRNMTQTFDLGSLLPELAEFEGGSSFAVMVVPGNDSLTAVLNPSTWTFAPDKPKDGYNRKIEPITQAAFANDFTLIDLAPLRGVLASREKLANPELLKVVYGFDMLLVMSGSTAASEFQHH